MSLKYNRRNTIQNTTFMYLLPGCVGMLCSKLELDFVFVSLNNNFYREQVRVELGQADYFKRK